MKKLLIALMMFSGIAAQANDAIQCDEGLLEVINPKARSHRMTDLRFADDMQNVYVRIGANIYLFEQKVEGLELVSQMDQPSIKASALKKFCKATECDEGLKEILRAYRGLLFSTSKGEKSGMTAMRLSDDLKTVLVRLGDRVYFFKTAKSGDGLEQTTFFGASSLETETIKKMCGINTKEIP